MPLLLSISFLIAWVLVGSVQGDAQQSGVDGAVPQVHPGPAAAAVTRQKAVPTNSAERYFESVKNNPPKLWAFLQQMPKGADLHNHLSGAIYAEDFIRWAAEAGSCINIPAMTVSKPEKPSECQSGQVPAKQALTDSNLYSSLLRAWSMLDWQLSGESGHDHFFATFGKFGGAAGSGGEMLAAAEQEAAHDHVDYLELMNSPNSAAIYTASQAVPWSDNFAEMTPKMVEAIAPAVAEARQQVDASESERDKLLKCGQPDADPACKITVRYLYQSFRAAPKQQVFALFLAGFELAKADARFVGINLVQPEDSYVSMRDFEDQMKMVGYLHSVYPTVHIALHAGELAPGLVPPAGLRNHIRESVEVAHADRIGHGAAIMHEDNPYQLMKEMAERNVMVEICLTSNKTILGISGEIHPLRIYIEAGVPVALATDDEGVSRSSMTREFFEAATEQHLNYSQLKKMARTGLEHSFIGGASLWKNFKTFEMVPQCRVAPSVKKKSPASCTAFLRDNPKASLEWELELEFAAFESRPHN